MRQLLFKHAAFLLLNEVSVLFNISSSHSNTNLQIRRFHKNNFQYLNTDQFYMLYYMHNHTH